MYMAVTAGFNRKHPPHTPSSPTNQNCWSWSVVPSGPYHWAVFAQSLSENALICLLPVCGMELPEVLDTSSAPKPHPLLFPLFFPGLKRPHQSCGSSPRPKQSRKQQLGRYQGGKGFRLSDWIALGPGHRSWTLSPADQLPGA